MGLDSGTWTAVAILDLDGRLVSLQSRKHWAHSELSAFVTSFGPVTIVATDRNPPSHAARKLASAYGARLFKPKRSLGVYEKVHSARFSGAKNAHERDAYAAAKKAFDVACSNKVRQLDRRLGERATASVKAAVLSGIRWDKALGSF